MDTVVSLLLAVGLTVGSMVVYESMVGSLIVLVNKGCLIDVVLVQRVELVCVQRFGVV